MSGAGLPARRFFSPKSVNDIHDLVHQRVERDDGHHEERREQEEVGRTAVRGEPATATCGGQRDRRCGHRASSWWRAARGEFREYRPHRAATTPFRLGESPVAGRRSRTGARAGWSGRWPGNYDLPFSEFIFVQASVAAFVGSLVLLDDEVQRVVEVGPQVVELRHLRPGEAGRDRLAELLRDRIRDRDRRVGRDVTGVSTKTCSFSALTISSAKLTARSGSAAFVLMYQPSTPVSGCELPFGPAGIGATARLSPSASL